MDRRAFLLLLLATLLIGPVQEVAAEAENSAAAEPAKWIISSGSPPSLPNGSLLGLALALERGASAIWLDLVLSKDDQLVLLGDSRIEQLTDVESVFPDRSRPDGGFYSFDFTLQELRQIALRPPAAGTGPPPALTRTHLPVTALADFLDYLDLVSADLAAPPTLICNLKHGWRHEQEDKDLGLAVLEALQNYRSTSGGAALIIASYNPEELQQLAQRAGEQLSDADAIGFMQLISSNDGREVQRLDFGVLHPYSYDLLFTKFGLKAVSGYAAAIGLDPEAVVEQSGQLSRAGFLDDARTLGLRVICTRFDSFRQWPPALEPGSGVLFEHLLLTIGFDGVVTSRDREARTWLENWAQPDETVQDSIIECLIDQIDKDDSASSDPVQSDLTR